MHRTIQKVTSDTETLNYNTAISAMMEYVNALREAKAGGRALVEPLVIMLAPYAPHFAEECWERLGGQGSVMDAGWPAFDPALTVQDAVELVVQVNGKVRGRLAVKRGVAQAEALAAAMADAGIAKHLGQATPKKVIFVQDRMLSIVV